MFFFLVIFFLFLDTHTLTHRSLTYPLDLLRTRMQMDASGKQVGLTSQMFLVTRRTWLEGWNLGLAAAAKMTRNNDMLRNAQLQSIRKNMLESGMVQPTGGRLGSMTQVTQGGGGRGQAGLNTGLKGAGN